MKTVKEHNERMECIKESFGDEWEIMTPEEKTDYINEQEEEQQNDLYDGYTFCQEYTYC